MYTSIVCLFFGLACNASPTASDCWIAYSRLLKFPAFFARIKNRKRAPSCFPGHSGDHDVVGGRSRCIIQPSRYPISRGLYARQLRSVSRLAVPAPIISVCGLKRKAVPLVCPYRSSMVPGRSGFTISCPPRLLLF